MSVRLLGSGDARLLADDVWRCYDQVFGDFSDIATWRTELFDRHAAREGYRLVVATDRAAVVGFAWAYVGRRGEYWPDLVLEALPPPIGDLWVGDHLELVELAVLSTHRRSGWRTLGLLEPGVQVMGLDRNGGGAA